MFGEWLRRHTYWLVNPIAKGISFLGIPPNWITVLGLLANVAVAFFVARGQLALGGILTVVASLFDAFDGALARASGKTSSFGAFLDSTLDRFSEAVIYLGLLIYYAQQNRRIEIILIYATIVGSLMVSYTRARAEGLGLQCNIGLLTRVERVCLLIIGLTTGIMSWMLWPLAMLTNLTVIQRVAHVWQLTHTTKKASTGAE